MDWQEYCYKNYHAIKIKSQIKYNSHQNSDAVLEKKVLKSSSILQIAHSSQNNPE